MAGRTRALPPSLLQKPQTQAGKRALPPRPPPLTRKHCLHFIAWIEITRSTRPSGQRVLGTPQASPSRPKPTHWLSSPNKVRSLQFPPPSRLPARSVSVGRAGDRGDAWGSGESGVKGCGALRPAPGLGLPAHGEAAHEG